MLRRLQPAEKEQLSARTRICAVYGHPIKHSASPAMQNAGIEALGLDWKYVACDVLPDDLPEAIRGAQAMRFIGLNLTVPHKLLALKLVDVLDETARRWGAVNTIRFEADVEGYWQPLAQCDPEKIEKIRSHGFNTDADAIIRSIEEDLDFKLQGSAVLLLGAGGAGRVAALKLADSGVKKLYLVNRTISKAEEIIREIKTRYPGVEARPGYPPEKIDLVLNATSLGLKPDDPAPFDISQFDFQKVSYAYDMIYRPAETPFLKSAKAAGCRVANGMGMLLYQGAKALEIWSGLPAPVEIMRAALQKHLYPAG
jgi:shikimate dehydrogenase